MCRKAISCYNKENDFMILVKERYHGIRRSV